MLIKLRTQNSFNSENILWMMRIFMKYRRNRLEAWLGFNVHGKYHSDVTERGRPLLGAPRWVKRSQNDFIKVFDGGFSLMAQPYERGISNCFAWNRYFWRCPGLHSGRGKDSWSFRRYYWSAETYQGWHSLALAATSLLKTVARRSLTRSWEGNKLVSCFDAE